MKSVTVVLPDDLATRAQAAGLLGDKRLEELIRSALRDQGESNSGSTNPGSTRRRLIRKNGRLVVEALPGERLISDAEVRDLLNEMRW